MVKRKHQRNLCRAAAMGLALCLVLSIAGLPAEASGTRGQNTASTQRLAEGTLLAYVIGGLAVLAVAVGAVLIIRKNRAPEPTVDNPKPTEPKPTEPEPMPPKPIPSVQPLENIRTMRKEWFLEVIDGPLSGLQYPIPQAGLLIGRSAEANIRFPEDTRGVSRRHCQVFWDRGGLKVMDLESKEGTYLTGEGKLVPQKAYPLTQGSVLSLGSKNSRLRVCTRTVL